MCGIRGGFSAMSTAATAITVTGLTKGYGGPAILDSVDMDVPAGDIVAIMGRSGSGKSTLLKLIGGLDTPDAGRVLHDGVDLSSMREEQRTRFRRESLGFVFQFFNLIPTLTVGENVALPLALNGWATGATNERVDALLESLDLADVSRKLPDQLSGGEQQRVAIARALAHRPGVIVADEPTGNLDNETAEHTLELLRSVCKETPATVIMATHSVEAAQIADRVMHLRNGRITGA
jgi:putative ABC transport system ATP-binding protein